MSKLKILQTLAIHITLLFLSARVKTAPQFSPEKLNSGYYDHRLYHLQTAAGPCDCRVENKLRRIAREPQYHVYPDDHQCFAQNAQEFYEPGYEYNKRYPRSGAQTNVETGHLHDFYSQINPQTTAVKVPSNPRLYVVRSASSSGTSDLSIDGDVLTTESGLTLESFPISMDAKSRATNANRRRGLSDEELGRIVRKAINTATGEDIEYGVPIQRKVFESSPGKRKAFKKSVAAYDPRIIRPNYETTLEELMYRQPAATEDQVESVEPSIKPPVVPEVSLGETVIPEVYQFVDDVAPIDETVGFEDNPERGIISDDVIIEDDVIVSPSNPGSDDQKTEKSKVDDVQDANTDNNSSVTTEMTTDQILRTETSEILTETTSDPSTIAETTTELASTADGTIATESPLILVKYR